MAKRPQPPSAPPPGRSSLSTRIRFSPQVLVFMATALLVFYPLREAVGAFIFWLHGASYRQVDFVVSEVVPNEGYPYARGLLEPGGTEWVMEVEETAAGPVVAAAPEVSAAPGSRIRVWWSETAPVVGFGPGRSTKIAPVAARPRVPGFGSCALWALCSLAALWLGLQATFRVARRFSREWRT
jgi:hypothetical protein